MADETQSYNIAAIRSLLLAAFTAEELRRFCQDRPSFSPILNDLGPNASLQQIGDQLITNCERRILFNELLDGVKEVNPGQYARYASQIVSPRSVELAKDEPEGMATREPSTVLPEQLPRYHKVGDNVKDRYEIRAILKERLSSTFRAVYHVYDTTTERDAVLKALYPCEPCALEGDRRNYRRAKERFMREWRALSIPHDTSSILTLYDRFEQDGVQYIVLEYIAGGTLETALSKQSLDWNGVHQLGLDICGGLQAIHKNGFLHLDLKPANIFLRHGIQERPQSNYTWAVIGDLGEARPVDRKTGKVAVEEDSVGTEGYKAPEIRKGQPASYQSDIFSVGVILFEAFTGKRFRPEGDFIAKSLAEMPGALKNSIIKAVRDQPTARFATASEMRNQLSPLSQEWPKRIVLGVIFALVAALFVGAILTLLSAATGFPFKLFPLPLPPAATSTSQASHDLTRTAEALVPLFSPSVTISPPTETHTPTPNPTPTNTPTPTPTLTSIPPTFTSTPTDIPTLTPTPVPIPPTPSQAPKPTPKPTASTPTPTPILSPQFGGLFCFSASVDGRYQTYVYDLAKSTSTPLYTHDGVVDADIQPYDHRLAYRWAQSGRGGIWRMDLDGSDQVQLTGFVEDRAPAWSTSGIEIFYSSTREKDRSGQPQRRVYRINSDNGGDELRFAVDGQDPAVPSDRELLFAGTVSWDPGKCGIVYLEWYRISGSGAVMPDKEERISELCDDRRPDTRNGQVVFMRREGTATSDIWRKGIDFNTKNPVNLTPNTSSSHEILPVFSPDGKWVAFASNRGGGWGIYAMKTDGTGSPVVLIEVPAGTRFDKWEMCRLSWEQ